MSVCRVIVRSTYSGPHHHYELPSLTGADNLARTIFDEVVSWLFDAGVLLKESLLMDASNIEAPNSTKNKAGARDPEMYQTKKANQWHFGMKAHIGVDTRTGFAHSFTTTLANVHDLNQAEHLLHGEEAFANSGYRGAEKCEELKEAKTNCFSLPSQAKLRH